MRTGLQIGRVLRHSLHYSNSGSTGVHVRFCLDDNEEISAYIWLSTKAMGIARKSLKAIGFDVDKRNIAEIDENQELLLGCEAQLDIQEETFNGSASLKVKWINPIPKPKSKDELDKLTKALRAAKKEEPPPDFETGSPKAEEIPF